jgi:hypothetical protein
MLQLLSARVNSNDPSRMRVCWLTLRPLQPSMLALMRPTVRSAFFLAVLSCPPFSLARHCADP